MSFTRTRRLIGLLILLLSLALLCWGLWPFGKLTHTIQLSPADLQLPSPESWLPELDHFTITSSFTAESTEIKKTSWLKG